MLRKYAHIPEINKGIVFSDPMYDETVWCQYRKNFTDKNWLMRYDSFVEDGIVNFNLCIGRPTCVGATILKETPEGDLQINFPRRYDVKKVELGIDTAKIFCGTEENWNNFREEAAIYTGADGSFGDLFVFTCKGEENPAGFLLLAAVDAYLINEEMLFNQLRSSFDGKEISQELYAQKADPSSIEARLVFASETKHAEEALKAQHKTQPKHEPER